MFSLRKYLTHEYQQHCSIVQCAKVHYRTHTRVTHFGNTVGLPTPVLNPNHNGSDQLSSLRTYGNA